MINGTEKTVGRKRNGVEEGTGKGGEKNARNKKRRGRKRRKKEQKKGRKGRTKKEGVKRGKGKRERGKEERGRYRKDGRSREILWEIMYSGTSCRKLIEKVMCLSQFIEQAQA